LRDLSEPGPSSDGSGGGRTLVRGLDADEVKERLGRYGPNLLYRPAPISFFRIARHEVTEPMILLLLVVGVLYSIWGKLSDAVTIFTIIVLLVAAEVYNEYRAKKAIAALARIAEPRVKVLREGSLNEIETEAVVPEDILVLAPGAVVAADARLVKCIGLQVDESTLTGEALPVDKKEGDEIYAGTSVVEGEGLGTVYATGPGTRLGEVAASAKQVRPPRTPLQLAMKALVGRLVFIALFFSVIIPVIGALQGQDIKTMLLTGLSLSFATIPEELPIIITMVLGIGAYTLSRHNFLIKKLRGAETLGSATVIVTDKTGTITEGRMRLAAMYPAGGGREVLRAALGTISDISPSAMEAEVLDEARKLDIAPDLGVYRQRAVGVDGRNTKAAIRRADGDYRLFVSGAPEEVFMQCRDVSAAAEDELRKGTAGGKRVIAVAVRELSPEAADMAFAEIETGMRLEGMLFFDDPPRPGVRETVETAAAAGIRTVMVTGDHGSTAGFVAGEVGIDTRKVITGKELDHLSDADLRKSALEVSVFARTTARHKHRIVKALQENGDIVAVTGDGVNDVLALKGADIGIAMGHKGTDVARDAADAVLADDNYITLTKAIFEGRKFFDNLRKGVTYYLSVKVALVMIFLLPVILGVGMPFSPIQIIILELFMDLAASAGFVAEPGEETIFSRRPRSREEGILSASVVRQIFLNGFLLFCSVSAVYFYARYRGLDVRETQTFAFSSWIFGHVVLAYVSRAGGGTVAGIGFFTNKIINLWAATAVVFLAVGMYIPFMRERFNFVAIPPGQLLAIAAVTVCMIGLLEVRKYFVGAAGGGASS
jgi:Ca2+-transporting ATPase